MEFKDKVKFYIMQRKFAAFCEENNIVFND